MSNAKIRRSLEGLRAPVTAWLIDNGYVVNEGGILEITNMGRHHIREAILVASRAVQNMPLVPPPRPDREWL